MNYDFDFNKINEELEAETKPLTPAEKRRARRLEARKKLEKTETVTKLRGLPGVISFLKTPFGFVTDVLLVGCTVAYTVLVIGGWGQGLAQYILLFLIVLTFRWHSIANGKNYRYKLLLKRRRKKNEVND